MRVEVGDRFMGNPVEKVRFGIFVQLTAINKDVLLHAYNFPEKFKRQNYKGDLRANDETIEELYDIFKSEIKKENTPVFIVEEVKSDGKISVILDKTWLDNLD